jgi:sulfite exporter TauE/SafE
MGYYLLVFVAGLAGSFHCIGMCGGFACALGTDPNGRAASVARHLLYNAGRVTTYVFLGLLAGSIGGALFVAEGAHAIPVLDGPIGSGQRILTVLAGGLMIVMALQVLGLLQRFHGALVGFGAQALVGAMRHLLAARGPAAPVALGIVNGFLPCPLVYAFVAQAASTANAPSGLLTMAAFGLGTFPAMLLMGGIGRLLRPMWRRRGVRVAGGLILALGLVTIGRGIVPLAAHDPHLVQHDLPAAAHEQHQ